VPALGRQGQELAPDELSDGCTESTVNFHLGNARRKLRVPTRQAAVVMAIQIGQLVV
jgi:ATP/maltotriose-dependent transcriptional regulator MalT